MIKTIIKLGIVIGPLWGERFLFRFFASLSFFFFLMKTYNQSKVTGPLRGLR